MPTFRKQRKNIHVYNESGLRLPLRHDEIRGIVLYMLQKYQLSSCEMNVIFMTDAPLRAMKKEYFGQDADTDIISFTMECCEDFLEGELYISLPRIRENALMYNASIRQECARIIIHGFLHLIGYEDSSREEKQQMRDLENQHLGECGYA